MFFVLKSELEWLILFTKEAETVLKKVFSRKKILIQSFVDDILDFLVKNFHDNKVQKMLPLSESEMRNFWGGGLASAKESQLVYQNGKLVGVENGDFLTSKEIKEEFDSNGLIFHRFSSS